MTTDEDWLDRILTEAQAQQPAPSQALMARILLDADEAREAFGAATPPRPGTAVKAWFDTLGGWLGVGGLAAAAAAGFWIGFLPPDALSPFLPVLNAGLEMPGLGLDDPFADLEP
jgi:hypothetical protein